MPSRVVLLSALTALSLLIGGDAAAADVAPTYVLDTVDSYHESLPSSGGGFVVTGVLHGQSAVTTLQVGAQLASAQTCERAFIQSINRPGRLTVSVYVGGGGQVTCGVTRNP